MQSTPGPMPSTPTTTSTPTPNAPGRRDVILGTGALALATAATKVMARQPDKAATTPASSAQAQQGAGFYRFKVGDLTCFAIGDAGMPGQGSAYPTFGANATQAEVDALTDAHFIPKAGGYSYFNVLLIQSAKDLILVDTGFGDMVGPAGGWLTRTMGTLGFAPSDVTTVVFSHLHPDHFGGYALADGSPRFSKAKVVVHEREHAFWNASAPDLSKSGVDAAMKGQMIAGAQATLKAIGDRLTLSKQGTEIAPGLTIEEAFGHTPGHQMLRLRSGSDELLMIADLVHHFAISFRRPEWHVAFDADAQEGSKTRRRMLTQLAKDRTPVMAYHTPWPGLGHVRAEGDAFAWEPTPWRW